MSVPHELYGKVTFCIIDCAQIPEERAKRKSNTCSKECNKVLNAMRRAMVDARRCRHCAKPSTPDQRKAYQAFLRSNPEYKPAKRGRPKNQKEQLET